MLTVMRPGDEHAFRADDPVARYWLHNCVGFRVRGFRGGGVVHAVSTGVDGVEVLEVERRALLGMTTVVPAARVESVDPWDETVVLRSPTRETRRRRVAQARTGAGVLGAAARAAAIAVAFGTRLFFAAIARFLLALAALLQKHTPRARRRVGRFAATLGLLGRAYAGEAARAYREQKAGVAAWREERRRSTWGDESPITRAGADEVDARDEDRIRRRTSTRAGR